MAVLGVVAALAVTVGALLLGLQFLRRWMERMPGGRQRVPIEMLQRSSIGALFFRSSLFGLAVNWTNSRPSSLSSP